MAVTLDRGLGLVPRSACAPLPDAVGSVGEVACVRWHRHSQGHVGGRGGRRLGVSARRGRGGQRTAEVRSDRRPAGPSPGGAGGHRGVGQLRAGGRGPPVGRRAGRAGGAHPDDLAGAWCAPGAGQDRCGRRVGDRPTDGAGAESATGEFDRGPGGRLEVVAGLPPGPGPSAHRAGLPGPRQAVRAATRLPAHSPPPADVSAGQRHARVAGRGRSGARGGHPPPASPRRSTGPGRSSPRGSLPRSSTSTATGLGTRSLRGPLSPCRAQ